MIFHARGSQLRVDLKTLETKKIHVDGVSCKRFKGTVHSLHHYDLYDKEGNKLVEAGEIEEDVIYLPRDTSSKVVSLLPYVIGQFGQGLQLYNMSLAGFLNTIGWEDYVDTNCRGITRIRTTDTYLGSEQVFSLNFWGKFAYCVIGDRGDGEIKEIESDLYIRGRLIDPKQDITTFKLLELPYNWLDW